MSAIGTRSQPVSALSQMFDDRCLDSKSLPARTRYWNHYIVNEFDKITPISGTTFLDVGASREGYALEAAISKGVQIYEGVTFFQNYWGPTSQVEFHGPAGEIGRLWDMNAESLRFQNISFDRILSFNTFEHFLRPTVILSEMYRVLKPGGSVLICVEGIWSSSFGYHLHQYGEEISQLIAPWSHLFLTETQMTNALAKHWPADAPISLDEAINWIYQSDELNRFGIHELKKCFETSALSLEWLVPLADTRESQLRPLAAYVSRLTDYSPEELLTRGMSVHLRKPG